VCLAVGLAACAESDPAGVTVKGFDDDLVFGVKEQPDVAGPNTLGSQVDPNGLSGVNLLPDQAFATNPGSRIKAPVARPRPTCPDADASTFPEEPAPLSVPIDRRPRVGGYRWKKSGFVQGAATVGQRLEVSGFEERVIRNITEKGPSTNTKSLGVPGSSADPGVVYTYETVQPDVSGNVVVSTFQVDTSPAGVFSDPAATGEEVRAGGPERGIVLKRLDIVDREGTTLTTFAPVTGLLLLPLPVRAGEDFVSSAIDSRTGATASFQGKVLDRQQVDACGEVVEAWLVRGTQTFSGEETITRQYELTVATGLGGIPVVEKIDQNDANGELHVVSTIGQLTPTPLADA
jgi:hypothetical protein